MIRTDVFGWFDDASQTTPAYDPGMGGACPACGEPLSRPVKTISLMPEGHTRSYFFRVHAGCWEGLGTAERSEIESSLIDRVSTPLHSHDCTACVFLGHTREPGRSDVFDLYACRCPYPCGRLRLIARWSADDYYCQTADDGTIPSGHPVIEEAYRRAKREGLIS